MEIIIVYIKKEEKWKRTICYSTIKLDGSSHLNDHSFNDIHSRKWIYINVYIYIFDYYVIEYYCNDVITKNVGNLFDYENEKQLSD